MPIEDLLLRPAAEDDGEIVTSIHLRSRRAAQMPQPVHTDDAVRCWLDGRLLADDVWLAQRDGTPLGYLRLTPGWLDDLYVLPEAAGQGVGTALLELAQARQPDGFCLWVFESNQEARRFYRSHGLVELERTDGSGNEEQAPDIRMAWPGADPVGFLRRLVDEVDDQLGDLLGRRLALTRAVQRFKPDRSRDPERERQIAARLARRAPELGEERVARIVQAVISESLDAS
jgi:chorismate mutase/GNAT superfamily N-acetyltransferase